MRLTFTPPIQLTLLRIVLTPLFVLFLFSNDLLLQRLSLIVFLIALMTDWYDGWVARKWGYVTRWGKFLDPLADKIVTSAALISFIYLDLMPAWPIWIIVVRDLVITLVRSYAEHKGSRFDTSKLAKTKTFLQFLVIALVLLLYTARNVESIRPALGQTIDTLLSPSLMYALAVVLAAVTLWSGISYVIDNWDTVRKLFVLTKRATESQ